MGWLENMETTIKFQCPEGHLITETCGAKEIDYAQRDCPVCQKKADYAGMVTREHVPVNRVAYDQNGRLAYRISDGKGSVTHISKTKYDFLESNGVAQSQYTPQYLQHVLKSGNMSEHTLAPVDINKVKKRPMPTKEQVAQVRASEETK